MSSTRGDMFIYIELKLFLYNRTCLVRQSYRVAKPRCYVSSATKICVCIPIGYLEVLLRLPTEVKAVHTFLLHIDVRQRFSLRFDCKRLCLLH